LQELGDHATGEKTYQHSGSVSKEKGVEVNTIWESTNSGQRVSFDLQPKFYTKKFWGQKKISE
jgi:hypothetical protein